MVMLVTALHIQMHVCRRCQGAAQSQCANYLPDLWTSTQKSSTGLFRRKLNGKSTVTQKRWDQI